MSDESRPTVRRLDRTLDPRNQRIRERVLALLKRGLSEEELTRLFDLDFVSLRRPGPEIDS
jgi:hypothetical protein